MSTLIQEKLLHLQSTVQQIKKQDRLRHEGDMENLFTHLQEAEKKLEEKKALLMEAKREQSNLLGEFRRLQREGVSVSPSSRTPEEIRSLLMRSMSVMVQLQECIDRLSGFLGELEAELKDLEKEDA